MSQPGQSAPETRRKRTSKRLEKQQQRALINEPFLDDAFMDDSPPACTLASFKQPRIRRCPHNLDTTTFVGRINPDKPTRAQRFPRPDGGLDGYNWKVCFADDDPEGEGPEFILKLFWDTSAPEELPEYYAAQRECQNAALFEMMEAALSKDEAGKGPVLVRAHPETREAAEANLFAFSDGVRREGRADDGLEPIKEMPRMRRCFGWMQFTGAELLQCLPRKLRPSPIKIDDITREIDKEATYTALVYEFVEKGDNDFVVVQEVLDFLWCVGFSFCPITKADNWESSVLLDYSDVVHLNGHGWNPKRFGNQKADDILWA